jgi:hypothetical protein
MNKVNWTRRVVLCASATCVLLVAAEAVEAIATCMPRAFATVGGGPTTKKLRIDPNGAENLGNEIGRFWESDSSGINNFDGECPSGGGNGWWKLNQPPLRGINGTLGTLGCAPSACPTNEMTLVVEEQSGDGDEAYLIAFRVDATPGGIRWFDFARVSPHDVLLMQELPRPQQTSATYGGGIVHMGVTYPDVAPNVHAVNDPGVDTPLPASAVVKSYDLYKAVTDDLPPGRDVASWTLVEQHPYADGPVNKVVHLPCPEEPSDNLFVALGVTFHGGLNGDVQSTLVSQVTLVEGCPPPVNDCPVVDCPAHCTPGPASGQVSTGMTACESPTDGVIQCGIDFVLASTGSCFCMQPPAGSTWVGEPYSCW